MKSFNYEKSFIYFISESPIINKNIESEKVKKIE